VQNLQAETHKMRGIVDAQSFPYISNCAIEIV
jgi:hypothetical protein